MKKSDTSGLDTFDDILQGIEYLRSHVVDLEAMTYGAEHTLEFIPNIMRTLRGYDPQSPKIEDLSEARLYMGRLHAFVVNASKTSRSVLREVEELLDKAQDTPRRRGNGNGKNGSSQASERRAVYHVPSRRGLRAVA